jgi:hypothetical protein
MNRRLIEWAALAVLLGSVNACERDARSSERGANAAVKNERDAGWVAPLQMTGGSGGTGGTFGTGGSGGTATGGSGATGGTTTGGGTGGMNTGGSGGTGGTY